MNEWLSYSPADLLMFAPETYFRLFERYNAALWPTQIGALAITLALVWLTRDADGQRGRWVAGLLGLSWAVIGWFFFHQLYAEIFLAAPWFGWGFGLQAVLLIGAVLAGRITFAWRASNSARFGLGLLLFSAFIHPLIGPLSGRSWAGVELFGLAPDPTALGTLGLLLMAGGRSHWWLAILPLLWCAVSGLTLLTMEAYAGLITPLLALFAVPLMIARQMRGAPVSRRE